MRPMVHKEWVSPQLDSLPVNDDQAISSDIGFSFGPPPYQFFMFFILFYFVFSFLSFLFFPRPPFSRADLLSLSYLNVVQSELRTLSRIAGRPRQQVYSQIAGPITSSIFGNRIIRVLLNQKLLFYSERYKGVFFRILSYYTRLESHSDCGFAKRTVIITKGSNDISSGEEHYRSSSGIPQRNL